MEIYLVGGAVRDELLGLPVTERDWVVVGSSPEEMLSLGYKAVGKDFPVFLHPQTHEEYALARTERKTGPGYTGFNFYAAHDVGLEADLKRRDLTINAMAKDKSGQLIDPFGGKKDLQNKTLRHVSPAFVEDPVRILRLARFASRFGDFTIHPDTSRLLYSMVSAGEIDALVAERVWQEWRRALEMNFPQRFFQVLQECQALSILFPEIRAEGIAALQRAAQSTCPLEVRFAVLFYNVKLSELDSISQRYRIPRNFYDLAKMLIKYYQSYQDVSRFSPAQILDLLQSLDAFRRPERFEYFLLACDVVAGKDSPSLYTQILQSAYEAATSINPQIFLDQGLQGEAIGRALKEAQVNRIAKIFS